LHATIAATAQAPSRSNKWVHEVAFQPRGEPWFSGTVVAIQVWPLERQPSPDEIADQARALTGVEPEEFTGTVREHIKRVVDVEGTTVRLDKTRPCFCMDVAAEVAGESTAQTSCAFFGRRSLVFLHFQENQQDRSANDRIRQDVFTSFRFDAGFAYDHSRSNGSYWTEVIGTVLGGLIVMWIVSAFRSRSREDEPVAEE
jgi:hypothetical protein